MATTKKATATTTAKNGRKSTKSETVSLGISKESTDGIVQILSVVLADEFVLYTKLRKYHWNVTGPEFFGLHAAFETQYDAVAEIVDVVAERIRAFGAVAPGTLDEFKKLSRLTEKPGVNPDWKGMVDELASDHEALVRNLRTDLDTIDDDYDEVGAEDLLTGILQDHQKWAWMLRSVIA